MAKAAQFFRTLTGRLGMLLPQRRTRAVDESTPKLLKKLAKLENAADPTGRRARARLGEELHKRSTKQAKQMDSEELLESLKSVAQPTSFSARIRAWVYVDALADRYPELDAVIIHWRDSVSDEEYAQTPAVRVIAAVTLLTTP